MTFTDTGPDTEVITISLPRHVARSLLAALSTERPPTEQVANVAATAIVDSLNPQRRRW